MNNIPPSAQELLTRSLKPWFALRRCDADDDGAQVPELAPTHGLLRWANRGLQKPERLRCQIARASSLNATATRPIHRLRKDQLVVASPEILDEALPGDDHPGAVVLLEATHRSQPRLQPTVVRLDSIVGVPVGSAPPGGSNSSSAIG